METSQIFKTNRLNILIRKREELKEIALRENYKQELLYQKIKEKTWDLVETQLNAVVALNSNLIVYNYNVRIRTPQELRKFLYTPSIFLIYS